MEAVCYSKFKLILQDLRASHTLSPLHMIHSLYVQYTNKKGLKEKHPDIPLKYQYPDIRE